MLYEFRRHLTQDIRNRCLFWLVLLSTPPFKEQISNFVITIGCFVTYCLIQSMAPKSWDLKVDNFYIEQGVLAKDKKIAIIEWITNCINPSQILTEFCSLRAVRRGLHRGISYPPPPLNIVLEYLNSPRFEHLSIEEKKNLEEYVKEDWNRSNLLYIKRKKNDIERS